MNWLDIKDNVQTYVIPLWCSEFAKNEIATSMIDGWAIPADEEQIKIAQRGVSDEFIIGYPAEEEDYIFMFGYKSDEGGLDDLSAIDQVIGKRWDDIAAASVIFVGTMESHSEMCYDEAPYGVDFDKYREDVDNFITDVIGLSVYKDSHPVLKNINDYKNFIESEYKYTNMRLTNKKKWGNFEYKYFENRAGDEVSLVLYNNKLISHYNFPYCEGMNF